MTEIRTAGGVRLRQWAVRPGELNWLFLPGGPGIGSESLIELVDAVQVPGTSWLVDLPGDGSNVSDVPDDPYLHWPQVVLEAAAAVPHPVTVGHSTGGMYLLSVPALAELVAGLVLISSAPNAQWQDLFAQMVAAHPLPEVDAATSLRDICVASAPWNFTDEGLAAGRDLLGRMPYNAAAVQWSADNFDHTYTAAWFPSRTPTLIVSGGQDRIVRQECWDTDEFRGPHVLHRIIDGAAHLPWIERPAQVRAAFADLVTALRQGGEVGTLSA